MTGVAGNARFLDGKVAAVTGAGRGIGQATAVALARAGVTSVALIARSEAQLEQTAQLVRDAGAAVSIITADLIEVAQVEETATKLIEQLGIVDVLVNNAGTVAPLGPTDQLSAVSILDAFRLNTIAPVLLTGQLIPAMIGQGWGRVVNVSSGVVARPGSMIGGSTYAATKAALETQTVSMAAEYAGTGVTVNVYRPGTVDTAMQEWIRTQDPNEIGSALHERFIAYHDSGSLLTAEASGTALVAHLTSDATGQIWDVTDRL